MTEVDSLIPSLMLSREGLSPKSKPQPPVGERRIVTVDRGYRAYANLLRIPYGVPDIGGALSVNGKLEPIGRVVRLKPTYDKSQDDQTAQNSSYRTPINVTAASITSIASIVSVASVTVVATGSRFVVTPVAIQATAVGQRVGR